MIDLSRRAALTGAAAIAMIPLAAALPVRAAAPLSGKQAPGFYRYKIGSFEVTAVNDGVWLRDLDDKFVRNASFADVQKATADARMPTGKMVIPFTALVVNTGSQLVLLDTATGARAFPTAGTYMDNLTAAGIDPKTVDTIVISHFHPDHINGIRLKDESLAFPNAEIMVPAPEWAHWMDDAKMNAAPEAGRGGFMNVRRVFGSIAGKVARYDPGKEVVPGITTIAAYGHTPGHTAFAVASGGQSLLVISDSTNNPALFVRHPEWQAVFDMDGAMAVENRKRLLDRAAADQMLVAGYHWSFPACGFISKEGSGYRLNPVAWSSLL